ncbi:DUF7373 family lipoprotein [Nocardia sp. CDC160]|uniref:DUF7373 family lipoprotein n=1 Tax=Nocardia sp. CDC160 TaxID=3112166 RepID=UPI002DB6BC19|nr:hypothetical protein [Nocardia sp. CDC160]MEC3913282.1 hypothetical protein [Nocardia sp. CDC160]
MLDMRHSFGRLRSARIGVRAAAVAAVAVSVLVSAGCGSESHAAEEQSVDLSKLDTGNYSTKPREVRAKDPAQIGRYLEALRLGNALPLAQDVDPALKYNVPDVNPFTNADSFIADQLAGNDAVLGWLNRTEFDANTPGLIAGFATGGRSDSDWVISYELKDAVMVFDSDSAATAAATALAHSGFGKNEGTEPAQSSRYPTAQIAWMPQSQALASWYATGRFVILALVINHENATLHESDQPGLIALADKAITVTADRMKAFQPTPKDKLADLPLDPEGLIRMTLIRPAGDPTAYPFDGTLDAHGALHPADDPNATKARFDKSGVDLVSFGAGQVVRTRDTTAAETYIADKASVRFQHRIDPPTGLPGARCVEYHGPDKNEFPFRCYAAYGRYAAEVWSTQKQDVYQRISAQYAMLVNSR